MVIKRRVVGVVGALALVAGCSSSDDGADEAPPTTGPQQPEQQPPQEIAAGADGFYDVPDPLPVGEHGDLVRYQEADTPPEGVRWYRVMYLSEKTDGDPTIVTGTIVVPQGEVPDGGWPVVSHAHGGNGIADDCSPSQALGGQDFNAVEIGLVSTMAAASGAIVVSSDYEGLGGPGEHPYLNGPSEGRGVLDIARAVRQLPGVAAGPTTAITGYSQGGHAALWAHQIAEEWTPDLEIVGTMAGAPATELVTLLDQGAIDPLGITWVPFIGGMAASDPTVDPAEILTPAGLDVLDQFRTNCVTGPEVTAGENVLKANPATTEPWKTLLDDNTPGKTAAPAPVLLIHSAQDERVPIGTSATLLARQCATGQVVERRILPEGDHVVAAVEAYQQSFTWFATLASGTAPVSSCP